MFFSQDRASGPLIYILRHRKERLSKCSLRGLEKHPDLRFYTHPDQTEQLVMSLLQLPSPICLTPNAPPLDQRDCLFSLIFLDATWRLSQRLLTQLDRPLKGHWQLRSLPDHLRTAYPRRQEDCPSPGKGLASIEALAAACQIKDQKGCRFLSDYRWRDEFLMSNRDFFDL